MCVKIQAALQEWRRLGNLYLEGYFVGRFNAEFTICCTR